MAVYVTKKSNQTKEKKGPTRKNGEYIRYESINSHWIYRQTKKKRGSFAAGRHTTDRHSFDTGDALRYFLAPRECQHYEFPAIYYGEP